MAHFFLSAGQPFTSTDVRAHAEGGRDRGLKGENVKYKEKSERGTGRSCEGNNEAKSSCTLFKELVEIVVEWPAHHLTAEKVLKSVAEYIRSSVR
jgi:hypothetical protein